MADYAFGSIRPTSSVFMPKRMRSTRSSRRLRRRVPRQRAGRFDFATQPAGRDIETVRPGRCTIFEEYACEKHGIAQRFEHVAAAADNGGEIILAGHAVAERRPQPMSAETF